MTGQPLGNDETNVMRAVADSLNETEVNIIYVALSRIKKKLPEMSMLAFKMVIRELLVERDMLKRSESNTSSVALTENGWKWVRENIISE